MGQFREIVDKDEEAVLSIEWANNILKDAWKIRKAEFMPYRPYCIPT